jgi:hypothetical protein
VKSRLKYYYIVVVEKIDESVLFVDLSRPTSFKHVSKWFWFSDSLGRVAKYVREKSIHTLQVHFVVGLPIGVVFPAKGGKDETH